jgi:hypothetical protein
MGKSHLNLTFSGRVLPHDTWVLCQLSIRVTLTIGRRAGDGVRNLLWVGGDGTQMLVNVDGCMHNSICKGK